MTLEIKDIVYLISYALTVAALYFSFRNRLGNIEREMKRSNQVIYGDQGRLNLVDTQHCKEHRDNIHTAIRRGEKAVEMLLAKLDQMNENVLLISFKMDQANGKKDQNNL